MKRFDAPRRAPRALSCPNHTLVLLSCPHLNADRCLVALPMDAFPAHVDANSWRWHHLKMAIRSVFSKSTFDSQASLNFLNHDLQ